MTKRLSSRMRTNPNFCKTCPFHGDKGIHLDQEAYTYYLGKIATFQSTHICHTTMRHHCRGGRQIMAQILCAFGLIDEATPEALQARADIEMRRSWLKRQQELPIPFQRPKQRQLIRPSKLSID